MWGSDGLQQLGRPFRAMGGIAVDGLEVVQGPWAPHPLNPGALLSGLGGRGHSWEPQHLRLSWGWGALTLGDAHGDPASRSSIPHTTPLTKTHTCLSALMRSLNCS